MEKELKPLWSKIFNFDWKFGLFLILLICIPRFILVLHGNEIANMQFVGILMLVMAILPFLFLSKYGRRKIGIQKPTNYRWLFFALGIGIAFSILLYFLGTVFIILDAQKDQFLILNSANIKAQDP